MRKKEILFGAAVLMAAALSMLAMTRTEASDADQVMITLNGNVYGIYSLTDDQDIEIVDEENRNIVHIEDEKVYMKEANCPDKYCVNQGTITNETQTIVCLPHKLVVEIVKGEGAEKTFDVIAK